jgi:hypothetical protein
MTASSATARPGAGSRAVGRALRVAGVVYVLAWLVGLVVAPAAPENTANAAAIHRYFAAHAGASIAQALLVHGLAGLALIVLAVGFARAFDGDRPLAAYVAATGVASAAVSLMQVGFAVAAAHDVRGTAAGTTSAWFHAINYADTVKLLLLAAFAATATFAADRAGVMPGWLVFLGRLLAPVLISASTQGPPPISARHSSSSPPPPAAISVSSRVATSDGSWLVTGANSVSSPWYSAEARIRSTRVRPGGSIRSSQQRANSSTRT